MNFLIAVQLLCKRYCLFLCVQHPVELCVRVRFYELTLSFNGDITYPLLHIIVINTNDRTNNHAEAANR